mmetsp:Transcript_2128/g.3737  ORF Transcript_2128/g.3737 Transcript_2128/m.3737 type:complete len:210 (-) Transcript_2128:41-670(-)
MCDSRAILATSTSSRASCSRSSSLRAISSACSLPAGLLRSSCQALSLQTCLGPSGNSQLSRFAESRFASWTAAMISLTVLASAGQLAILSQRLLCCSSASSRARSTSVASWPPVQCSDACSISEAMVGLSNEDSISCSLCLTSWEKHSSTLAHSCNCWSQPLTLDTSPGPSGCSHAPPDSPKPASSACARAAETSGSSEEFKHLLKVSK